MRPLTGKRGATTLATLAVGAAASADYELLVAEHEAGQLRAPVRKFTPIPELDFFVVSRGEHLAIPRVPDYLVGIAAKTDLVSLCSASHIPEHHTVIVAGPS